jgi:tetratricopeptide (TPR) repeat protein
MPNGILGKIKRLFGPDPESPGFAKIAEAMRLEGHTRKAIPFCLKGLKSRPGYGAGYYILARCYMDEGLRIEARDTLMKVLQYEPHHIAALMELATIYDNDGNKNQAINWYRQALAIDPLNTRVRTLLQRLDPESVEADEKPMPVSAIPAPVLPAPDTPPPPDQTAAETLVLSESPTAVEEADADNIETEAGIAEPATTFSSPGGAWIAGLLQDDFPPGDPPSVAESDRPESMSFNALIFESFMNRESLAETTATRASVDEVEMAEEPETIVEAEPLAELTEEPESIVESEPLAELTEEPEAVVEPELTEEIVEEAETVEPEMAAVETEASVDEVEMAEEPQAIVAPDPSVDEVTPIPVERYLDQFFPVAADNGRHDERSSDGETPSFAATELTAPTEPLAAVDSETTEGDTGFSDIPTITVGARRWTQTPPARADEETFDEEGASEDPHADAIPTVTLAELYVRQGLLDRAISVYLAMIEHDPTNSEIHKRLSDLFVMKSEQESS